MCLIESNDIEFVWSLWKFDNTNEDKELFEQKTKKKEKKTEEFNIDVLFLVLLGYNQLKSSDFYKVSKRTINLRRRTLLCEL